MATLKLTNVRKTFNKGTVTEKRALTGVNLELHEGDFVTVIGGNGAGKSTLLNMIAGVYPLDSGTIELDGKDISRLTEPQRAKYLGRVFQDPMRGTAADMQIEENLALAKRRGKRRGLAWGVTKEERAEYPALLKTLDLGLDTRMSAKVGLLSGGQRQALTLLMATLTDPKLLLLDEHTAALDPKTARKVLELTEKIVNERQLTTLMVTHNMNDAIRLGNRLIMMHEGHVIFDVSGEEKKALTVPDLLQKFEQVSGGEFANDRMLLN
ncbi:ATP-binding cassette domain-containing protein [uncultured Parolsenella sp.]|uniref:ABC transporter ATP-binding protein n=1 Tax=uncultured Parolsenella sp. TaxID=2083008 RepID=UPI0027D977D0|nr:ATP-binding cassette domain-containing protein [uncultured Parolsenella sp.]